jgi:hypothetical protein
MTLLIIYLILLAITLALFIGAYRKPIEEKGNVIDLWDYDENSYC